MAAVKGISQVVICRIIMCAPGMTILPVIMARLEKYPWMQRIRPLHAPFQVMVVGCFLVFMVPFACAIFPQRCSLKTSTMAWLEPEEHKKMKEKFGGKGLPQYVYFNKGL